MPNGTWNRSGSKNGDTITAIRNKDPPQIATANVCTFRQEKSMRGWALRCMWRTAIQPASKLYPKNRQTVDHCEFRRPRSSRLYIKATHAVPASVKPFQSKRRLASSRSFSIHHRARTIPTAPRGTFKKKIQRQEE